MEDVGLSAEHPLFKVPEDIPAVAAIFLRSPDRRGIIQLIENAILVASSN